MSTAPISLVVPAPKQAGKTRIVARSRRAMTAELVARQKHADSKILSGCELLENSTLSRRKLYDAMLLESPFAGDETRKDACGVISDDSSRATFDAYLAECSMIADHYRAATMRRDDLTPEARKERLSSAMNSLADSVGIVAKDAKVARGVAMKQAKFSVLCRELDCVSANYRLSYFFRDTLLPVVVWHDASNDWRLKVASGERLNDEHKRIIAACFHAATKGGKDRREQKQLFADYLRANGILKAATEKTGDDDSGITLESVVSLAESFIANNPGCERAKLRDAIIAAIDETLAADETGDEGSEITGDELREVAAELAPA